MIFVSGVVVFSVCWWICFFMLLPVGVQVPHTAEEGHAASAPRSPALVPKAIGATVFAAIITACVVWVVTSGHWNIEEVLGVGDWSDWEKTDHAP